MEYGFTKNQKYTKDNKFNRNGVERSLYAKIELYCLFICFVGDPIFAYFWSEQGEYPAPDEKEEEEREENAVDSGLYFLPSATPRGSTHTPLGPNTRSCIGKT